MITSKNKNSCVTLSSIETIWEECDTPSKDLNEDA